MTQNLNKELAAAKTITAASETIFCDASSQPEEEEKAPKYRKEKYSANKSKEMKKDRA